MKILEVYSDLPKPLLSNYKFFDGLSGGNLLLNSYGIPSQMLKIREHGASLEEFDQSVLSNDSDTIFYKFK